MVDRAGAVDWTSVRVAFDPAAATLLIKDVIYFCVRRFIGGKIYAAKV